MATSLIRSPELNATNNLLESFKGLYDVMVNPSATSMEKQAAFFAFASAGVAAGGVIRDSPLLNKIGGAAAGAGLAISILQLKGSIDAWKIAAAGVDQAARQTAYIAMIDKSIGFVGSFGATVAAVPGLQVAGLMVWGTAAVVQEIHGEVTGVGGPLGNAAKGMAAWVSKNLEYKGGDERIIWWTGSGIANTSSYQADMAVYQAAVSARTPTQNIAMNRSPDGYILNTNNVLRYPDGTTNPNVVVVPTYANGIYTTILITGREGQPNFSVVVKKQDATGALKGTEYTAYKDNDPRLGLITNTIVVGGTGTTSLSEKVPTASPYQGSLPATFVEVTSLGASGYDIIATTNNSTGLVTYQLTDASGNPVTSGSNYTVAQNNTIVFDAGTSKQIYDLGTGRLAAQIDANGSGFIVGANGNDTYFTAGQLAYNANSGILTSTVGAQSTQYFGTSNVVNVTTTTTDPTPSQTPIPDSTSGGPSVTNNNLASTADYTVGIGSFWDVNTAAGNQAIAGYAVTQGLRPGNSNLGLNINASTGIGLQIPGSPGNTSPVAGPVDYSLFGSSINNAAQSNFFQVPVDPLVLDLNGDGVKLTNFTDNPVLFDADNDGGSLEQTGWVSAQDGIVVHDINNDGKINNISETLSEYYNGVAGSGGVAGTKPFANGFAALKSLDSNADNQFTSADAAWNQLRVWNDSNHDGKTDAGELKTFAQLGITAINLNTSSQSGEVRDGNEVLARGTFTQNGQTREAIAANFIANPAGSTITQGSNGITVATEGLAGTGATSSYVSTNTTTTVNESLSTSTLGVKNITGGAGSDTITGDAQNNWLAGGLGADKLYGGAGDDVLLKKGSKTMLHTRKSSFKNKNRPIWMVNML